MVSLEHSQLLITSNSTVSADVAVPGLVINTGSQSCGNFLEMNSHLTEANKRNRKIADYVQIFNGFLLKIEVKGYSRFTNKMY